MFLLYRLTALLGFPLLISYVLWRIARNPAYCQRVGERFGFTSLPRQRTPGAIWIHAVSVGEVTGAAELIAELRARLPGERIFLSCSTLAGRELAEKRLSVDGIFYLPFDYVFAVWRVLRALRPTLVVVMETEIWPNLFREVKRSEASLIIVNARISDRALVRYRRIQWLLRNVLPLADAVLAQSHESGRRYQSLGASQVLVTGNLKYDFRPPEEGIPEPVRRYVERLRPSAIWIAASTMPPLDHNDIDEDDAVIEAWKQIAKPDRLLILVPRKPERFDIVAAKLTAVGLAYVRRTELDNLSSARVLLLDTIGELSSLFALPAVVFMGGTLARRGGHNLLEPAFFGRPIVTGPNTQNFAEIAADFRDAVEVVQTVEELGGTIDRLMRDAGTLGTRAKGLAEVRRGATARTVAIAVEAYEAAVPRYRPAAPAFAFLWSLSLLWEGGGWLKRRLTNQVRLGAPVISVGALTMGGAGKTPLVRWLTRRYAHARPAVLMRGYGRTGKELVVLQPGQQGPVDLTGDEAQIYLRDGIAALGICADRVIAAEHLPAGIYLLDDGFQHAKVARDQDLLALDARDPFGGGYVFPLGWLREAPAAARRATTVVITRAEAHRTYAGLIARLGKPVTRAELVPEVWISLISGEHRSPRAFAGCRARLVAAIGNPDSFTRTVRSLGIDVESEHFFPDHHPFRPEDLDSIIQPPALVLMTEKDVSKIMWLSYPDAWYLRVELHVEGLPQTAFKEAGFDSTG